MDIDMSLDDIIQKKGIKSNNTRRKGRFQRNENNNLRIKRNNNNNNNNPVRKIGNTPVRKIGNAPVRKRSIQDARNKIIQNSRRKITDAREKLVQLAKQSDAREKLNKLQQRKLKTSGQNSKKTIFRSGSKLILRSIDPSVMDPSIKIEGDYEDDQDSFGNIGMLRRTVNNSRPAGGLLARNNCIIDLEHDEDAAMYSMERPPALTNKLSATLPTRQAATGLKIVTHNDQLTQQLRMKADNWETHAPAPAASRLNQPNIMRGRLLENDIELRINRNPRAMSQEMKSRLDTPPTPVARSMGIFSGAQAPSASLSAHQPHGHRIVVSNLHTKVSHEDIKELFGDLGQLVASHVVRPGTAEVIYVNQKDAIAAVDAYHNRTLDGRPMKCMLVNPRQPPISSSSARPGTKYPSSTKSAVLPDLSAIHKALFNK